MSNNLYFNEIVAGAGDGRAMETETIQKNGAGLKNRMGRGNFIVFLVATIIAVMTGLTSCEMVRDDEENNDGGGGSGKLKAPTGVVAAGTSSRSITISWNAVTDASWYYIYRSDNVSGPYVEISTYSSATSYTNSNLSPHTTFYYKVAARDGLQSVAVSATTFLVAPTGVSATSETASSITISWDDLSGATGYRIHRAANSFDPDSKIYTSTSTSFTDTGLPSNVQCSYQVSGYNNITGGDNSQQVSVTTLLKPPTGVTAEGTSSSSITISWNAVTDASYYYIYRSDNDSGPFIYSGGCYFETSYKDTGLSPGTTFYYKVSARNGEQSEAVFATTL